MLIEQAKNRRDDIAAILLAQKRPVDDLPEALDNFLSAIGSEKTIGVIGLESDALKGGLRI